MTAERFELCEINCFDYGIEVFNEIMDNGVPLSQKQVCELLNEQHETIGRLKENIDELMCVNVEEELLKENEQLKTDNGAFIQDIEVFKEENTMLKLQVETKLFSRRELEQENEQLKQQVQKIHKLINSKIQSARELGSVRTVIALKNLQRELNGDIE